MYFYLFVFVLKLKFNIGVGREFTLVLSADQTRLLWKSTIQRYEYFCPVDFQVTLGQGMCFLSVFI